MVNVARKRALFILFGLCFVLSIREKAQARQTGFHVYDIAGNELRWEKFRQVEENWRSLETAGETERQSLCAACKAIRECHDCRGLCDPAAGDVDILLNPRDLSVVSA